jgi:hypothetical protein
MADYNKKARKGAARKMQEQYARVEANRPTIGKPKGKSVRIPLPLLDETIEDEKEVAPFGPSEGKVQRTKQMKALRNEATGGGPDGLDYVELINETINIIGGGVGAVRTPHKIRVKQGARAPKPKPKKVDVGLSMMAGLPPMKVKVSTPVSPRKGELVHPQVFEQLMEQRVRLAVAEHAAKNAKPSERAAAERAKRQIYNNIENQIKQAAELHPDDNVKAYLEINGKLIEEFEARHSEQLGRMLEGKYNQPTERQKAQEATFRLRQDIAQTPEGRKSLEQSAKEYAKYLQKNPGYSHPMMDTLLKYLPVKKKTTRRKKGK